MRYLIRKITLALFATSLISGCGGDSLDNTAFDPTTQVQFAGRLVDSISSEPLSGATVSVRSGNVIYRDTTGTDGEYEFSVPVADLTGVPQVAMEIFSEDYKFSTVSYSSIEPGTRYTLSDSSSQIEKHPQNALFFDDMEIAGRLIHLGDDNFSGGANSKLQISSNGIRFGRSTLKFDLTTEMLQTYSSISITFGARGVQRENTIHLGSLATNTSVQSTTLTDSNADGLFTAYNRNFDISSLSAGEYFFLIESKQNSGGDYDDFEFISFYGTLN